MLLHLHQQIEIFRKVQIGCTVLTGIGKFSRFGWFLLFSLNPENFALQFLAKEKRMLAKYLKLKRSMLIYNAVRGPRGIFEESFPPT